MATAFDQPTGWVAKTVQNVMNPVGYALDKTGIAKKGTFVNNATNLLTGSHIANLADYWTNEPGHEIHNLRDVAGAARHFFQTGINDSMDEAMWKYVAPGVIGAYNQGLGAAAGAFGGALSEAEHGEDADATTGDFIGSMLEGVGSGMLGSSLGKYLGVGAAEGAGAGAAAGAGAGAGAVEAGTGAVANTATPAATEAPSTLELLSKAVNLVPSPSPQPQQAQAQPTMGAQPSQANVQAQQQAAETEKQIQKLREEAMAKREKTTLTPTTMGIPGTSTTKPSVIDGGPMPEAPSLLDRLFSSVSESYGEKPHVWAKVMDQIGSGFWSREQGNPFAGVGTQLAESASMGETAQAQQSQQSADELAMYQAVMDLLSADEAPAQNPNRSALRKYSLMEPGIAGDYLSGRRTY